MVSDRPELPTPFSIQSLRGQESCDVHKYEFQTTLCNNCFKQISISEYGPLDPLKQINIFYTVRDINFWELLLQRLFILHCAMGLGKYQDGCYHLHCVKIVETIFL